ncbi:MAG: hypothetical protein V1756_00565 [Patescibacteria group bacterium]
MMKKGFFIFLILIFLFGGFNSVFSQSGKVQIDFFYSETCPHCKAEKGFLDTLAEKYPEVVINRYEVINNTDNQKILNDFYGRYQVPEREMGFVPVTFTSTKYFVGFSDSIGKEIESCIRECLGQEATSSQTIKVPFFGEIEVSKISLPVLTIVLGTLDGFNPCAMWILLVLVSLLLSLKSRKKIAIVGGTFILAEGLLYFLMMSAWLNIFLAMSFVSITRVIIGIFGVAFGVMRVRDFFLWKPGVCKVVDEKSQNKIMDRINRILKPSAVPATILGVIALAFGTNLIEFFCSAGFPTIFTRVLALQDISTVQYYLYLVFYNIFYMLDDFVVFGAAFFTLSHFNFSDKYNRYSTLIAGLLILILGVLLIFKPEVLMFV